MPHAITEMMTALNGTVRVRKNHPRIIFRGAIDSFIAELLLVMAWAQAKGASHADFLTQLIDLHDLLKRIQTAEALDQPLDTISIWGLSEAEVRARSHHPQKYYHAAHLFNLPHTVDERVLRANILRTKARELEIKAVDAYAAEDSLACASIISALNRLSSALYLMELQVVSGKTNEI